MGARSHQALHQELAQHEKAAATRFLGGPALAVLAGTVALANVAWAVEIHFIAEERGEKRAAGVPREVVVHRSAELQDGLVLVLKNPTYRTHAFAAYPTLFSAP